jgi:hypothetical protein
MPTKKRITCIAEQNEMMRLASQGLEGDIEPYLDPEDILKWANDPRLSASAKKTMYQVIHQPFDEFMLLYVHHAGTLEADVSELQRYLWIGRFDWDVHDIAHFQFIQDIADAGLTEGFDLSEY